MSVVPSRSLLQWQNQSASALDEIEAAHRAVRGNARGRRYATQQINQAYVVLLSSRFQQFCRDLHSEAVDQLVLGVPAPYRLILQSQWSTGRHLDRGNPTAGNLGNDFAKLGMEFWRDVYSLHAQNQRRRALLDELMEWRNAIGHQDFRNKPLLQGQTEIGLGRVQQFRSSCGGLARYFDQAVLAHIHAVGGPNLGW